jgi:hypothetical protein
VEAEGADHFRHIHLVGHQHLVCEGIVSRPPEAGSIARKAAIADVHDRDPEFLARQNLKVAGHVTKAHLAGHRHGRPARKRLLGRNGSSQADIAPAQEAARDERVEDGAQLVARVAGLVRHERIAQIQHPHEIAVHPIGVDRLLVGDHDLPVSGERLVACRPHLRRHITGRPSGTGEVRSDTSWRSACKVTRASPITACAVGYSAARRRCSG